MRSDARGASSDPRRSAAVAQSAEAGRFVIPVTVDDLAANGLLGEGDPQTCWKRSVETLTARKDNIAGLAVASDERIEAYVLYERCGVDPEGARRRVRRPVPPTWRSCRSAPSSKTMAPV